MFSQFSYMDFLLTFWHICLPGTIIVFVRVVIHVLGVGWGIDPFCLFFFTFFRFLFWIILLMYYISNIATLKVFCYVSIHIPFVECCEWDLSDSDRTETSMMSLIELQDTIRRHIDFNPKLGLNLSFANEERLYHIRAIL